MMRPQSRQQRIVKSIRFIMCRDITNVSLNDDGVFLRIYAEDGGADSGVVAPTTTRRYLESNVQWNTLNPKWPVGENTLPSYFVMQLVRVTKPRDSQPLREEDYVADLASSTLSRPRTIEDVSIAATTNGLHTTTTAASHYSWKSRFETSMSVLQTYRFTRANENAENEALAPIGSFTSKDIHRIRKFPPNSVVFEVVPGE